MQTDSQLVLSPGLQSLQEGRWPRTLRLPMVPSPSKAIPPGSSLLQSSMACRRSRRSLEEVALVLGV